ncbi:hypothetical protein Hamer_G005270 [Homarus americanus]|uniref:Leydig cell tumor 10 kDa protein homolog n=1 Tax=Homarus americanus TaxID=6706 RepID=A0A8J5K3P8_HOMAM|nr:hypothetical protein Hamer_G005270 [Homarus americanus]
MPQGSSKNKKAPQVPSSLKKGKRQNTLKMRKGKRTIAPKKAKAQESLFVQKQLQKAINANIEEEMKQRASKDFTALKLLKDKKKTAAAAKKAK